jgi:phage terminase large subunit GpA-like protein
MEQFHENALATYYQALPSVCIREPLTIPQWARKFRRIGQGGSPLSMHGSIEYDVSVMPWCEEPMIAATDPTVTHLVLWFASGMGKTDGVVSNVIGWAVTESPRNIMALYPTESARDKWSRDVLQRTIEATPILKEKVTEKKGGEGGNTIAYKAFPGGSLYATFAGSPTNLRGPRVGLAYAGEVDAMPIDVGGSAAKPGEGDPLGLLFRRCEGFEDAIKIIEGTGTIKGRSRIESWYGGTDQRKWFVRCRRCGEPQVLFFRHLKWAKGKTESAEIECEHCSALHNDRQRLRIVREGQWKPTAPFTGMRGYWINQLNATLPAEKGYRNKMHQIAEEWTRAKRADNAREMIRTIINTVFAETDAESENDEKRMEWEPLYNRREAYSTDKTRLPVVPEPVRVITAAVDVQGNRLEVLFNGFARDEQAYVLHLEVIPGDPRDNRVWDELDKIVSTWRFKHPSGADLEVQFYFLDRGKWTEWVDKFCARAGMAGKVYSCKGASEMGAPIIGRLRNIGRGRTYFRIGTDAAKEWIYGKLALPWPTDAKSFPPGFIHFCQTLDPEFFKQLTAEKAFTIFQRGAEYRKYKKENDNDANEALDLFVYSLAAFRLRRWAWDEIDKMVSAPRKKSPDKVLRRDEDEDGGFVTGWRK